MKNYLCFLVGVLSLSSLFAQEETSSTVKAYCDIAVNANLWTGAEKTIGIQTTAGVIINRKISLGAGIGVSSRNYEYLTVPFEFGVMLWDENGAMRIYGGPTFETYGTGSGYLAGTEVVFRPRFELRKLKLFIAFGVAFDNSKPYSSYYDPFGPIGPGYESSVLASPRFRIGLGL